MGCQKQKKSIDGNVREEINWHFLTFMMSRLKGELCDAKKESLFGILEKKRPMK